LNLRLIELAAGRSSQATLLGRRAETYESLYLSPALVERLGMKLPLEQMSLFEALP
jgi:DNA adenine methylase